MSWSCVKSRILLTVTLRHIGRRPSLRPCHRDRVSGRSALNKIWYYTKHATPCFPRNYCSPSGKHNGGYWHLTRIRWRRTKLYGWYPCFFPSCLSSSQSWPRNIHILCTYRNGPRDVGERRRSGENLLENGSYTGQRGRFNIPQQNLLQKTEDISAELDRHAENN